MNFLPGGMCVDAFVKANALLSKFSRNYMDLKSGLPVRPSEMGVLNIITETPGPHTPLMLAEMLGVSKSMIAAHLAALIKKGYITKQASKDDKRSYYVIITEEGRALVSHAKCETKRQLSGMLERMGQERFEHLIALIEEANNYLETRCEE